LRSRKKGAKKPGKNKCKEFKGATRGRAKWAEASPPPPLSQVKVENKDKNF